MPTDEDENHIALQAILARLATDASVDSERVAEAELATFLERYAVEVESSLRQTVPSYSSHNAGVLPDHHHHYHHQTESAHAAALPPDASQQHAETRRVRSSEEVVASSLLKLMALSDTERSIAKHVYLSVDVEELYGGAGLRKLLERCGALTPPSEVLESLVREVVSSDDRGDAVHHGAGGLRYVVNPKLPSFDPLLGTTPGTLTARMAARVGVAAVSSARRRQQKLSALSSSSALSLTLPLSSPRSARALSPSGVAAEGDAGSGMMAGRLSPRMVSSSARKGGAWNASAICSARRSPKAAGSHLDGRDAERTSKSSSSGGVHASPASGKDKSPFITLQVFWQCLQRLKRRQYDEVIRHSQSLAEQTLSDALTCVVEECRAAGAVVPADVEVGPEDEFSESSGGKRGGGGVVHQEDVDGYLQRVFGLRWMPLEQHDNAGRQSFASGSGHSASDGRSTSATVTCRNLWRALQPTPRVAMKSVAASTTPSHRSGPTAVAAAAGIPAPSAAGWLGTVAPGSVPRLAISDADGSSSLLQWRHGENSVRTAPGNAASLSARSAAQSSSSPRLSSMHNGSMQKIYDGEEDSQQQQQQQARGSFQVLFLPNNKDAVRTPPEDGTPVIVVPPSLRGSPKAPQATRSKRLPVQTYTESPLGPPPNQSLVPIVAIATPGRGGRTSSFGSRTESASPTGSTDYPQQHHHLPNTLNGGRDSVDRELDVWTTVESRPASPHSSTGNGLSRPASFRQADLRRASCERKEEYQRRLSGLKRTILEQKLTEQDLDASRLSRRKSLCALKSRNRDEHDNVADRNHNNSTDLQFVDGVGKSLSPEKRYELLGGLGFKPSLYTTHGNPQIYQRGLNRLRRPQNLNRCDLQRPQEGSGSTGAVSDVDSGNGPQRLVRCHSASVQGPRIAGAIRRQAAAALSAYAASRFNV